MRIPIAHPAAIFLIALLATSNATAAPVIVESRATHAAKLEVVEGERASIHALADRNDAAGLVSALDQFDADKLTDPAVRDHLLETTLFQLSRTTPDPAARAAVNRYRNRPVSTFVRLQEDRGQLAVPLYDVAAAARLTIRIWNTADAKELVSTALRAGRWQPGDFLQPQQGLPLGAWQAGTQRALESADRPLIAATKSALLQSQTQSDEYDALVLTAATRLSDADLYGGVINRGDTPYAREAIRSVYRALDSADATRLLISASARPELASAAILELGSHGSNDPALRSWLLNQLGDPENGASAALALARVANDDVLNAIQDVILGDATELTKLRAALVLRISDSPAAQSLRLELSSQNLSSEKLREALR